MTKELITATEARQEVLGSVEDKLSKAAIRDLTRAIRKQAKLGLREVQLFAPAKGTSRNNQERNAVWSRASRAVLTGAGFDVQHNNSGAGSFLLVRW